MYFPNFKHCRARTLWARLGAEGRNSVVINVPSTYPARPLKGVLTAGFVALDLKKATYPPAAYEYLSSIDYRIDVDTRKARESLDLLMEDLKITLAKRREAILHYLDKGEWDLFVGVVTETDRLHHFMWHAYDDPADPRHEFFIDFYRDIDSLIGEVYDRLRKDHPGVPLFVMSDHGFTGIKTEVYINHWLRENGYQDLAKSPAQTWADMGDNTKAFALDPSRIYINLKGKYPRGAVELSDKDRIVDEIAGKVMSIEHEGVKVIRAAYRKDEIFKGPLSDNAPDLILLSEHGYDLKGAMGKDALFDKGPLTGMHTQDDAVLVASREAGMVVGGDVPKIYDVPATIASLLGIDAEGLEGRALL
jgi:predicted AlkP superfamily phosphohydrolase/phosphomutase